MAYLMIAIALVFLATKGVCGKKVSNYARGVGDAFLFNLIRMLLCAVIGFIMLITDGGVELLKVDGRMIGICALSGFVNAAFLVSWLFAVRKNTMVVMDVGLLLGSLIPSILCAILYSEPISWFKMLGFAIIMLATLVLVGHNKVTADGGILGTVLLIVAAVSEGTIGFAQQLYKQYYTEAGTMTSGIYYPKTVFHFYTYVFAAAGLLAVLIAYSMLKARKSRGSEEGRRPIPLKIMLHIAVMAICLFAGSYFQTVATNDYGMSSQMMYPIVKGGCLITVNITAMIFFGEKMTRRSILGSVIAMVGIICMSIL